MPNPNMTWMSRFASLFPLFLLASCATIPSGPSVMVLPGSGKNFDQFRQDDMSCRQYAGEQSNNETPNDASIYSGVGTAALGAGLGAAAGAILGGGSGAAIGAGSGLLAGGLMGTGTATASGNILQQRYDIAYTQCMYGKGHNVPVSGQIANDPRNQPAGMPTQSAPAYSIPPPPPGTPPAPPQ
jgi:hypothetical protein